MAASWDPINFPHLTGNNHQITSQPDNGYNCIAWAAGDTGRWWWPLDIDSYWPCNALNDESVEAFLSAYAILGYQECHHGRYENGFEKIAIYARYERELWLPTHAARQLPNGRWTSKLGACEDIAHLTTNDVNGPGPGGYGKPVRFMKRPSAAHRKRSRWSLHFPPSIGRILSDFFPSLDR